MSDTSESAKDDGEVAQSAEGTERSDEQPAALVWHVWVARYDNETRNDHLVFGDSDDLEEHAPAIAHSRIADVEHFGTFADFAGMRSTIDLDLPETIPAPGELTNAVGRGAFWNVVWGDLDV